jgi:hypothetical protein
MSQNFCHTLFLLQHVLTYLHTPSQVRPTCLHPIPYPSSCNDNIHCLSSAKDVGNKKTYPYSPPICQQNLHLRFQHPPPKLRLYPINHSPSLLQVVPSCLIVVHNVPGTTTFLTFISNCLLLGTNTLRVPHAVLYL